VTRLGWQGCWRIARRDLNPRLRGLRLLFVCLFLGVATLAAIGSLTAAITGALAEQGQELLGGDVEVGIAQREATPDEKDVLDKLGRVSATIRMRAMAHRAGPAASGSSDGPRALLSEIKGVDRAYPLYGRLVSSRGASVRKMAPADIFVDEALAGRLALRIGDQLRYGEAVFRVRDLIVKEPDRVGEGFTLGSVAIVSLDGLRRTQLLQPGSLFESKYRIALPPGADAGTVAKALTKRFSSAGWDVKERDRAAPGANRFFERMGQFLSLIGLVALIVAGIGVGNGVASYLGLKRGGIATLKILGAASGDIERIYMLQIGAVAAAAIACGLGAGALLPAGLIALAGNLLPVEARAGFHPGPLAASAVYGLLIVLIFTLPALGRARILPAAALFRTTVERRSAIDRRGWLIMIVSALAVLLLAVLTARQPLFALAVLGAAGAVLLLLMLIGWAVKRLASRLPRPRRPLLRLVLANFHRPGAQTVPLIIALGLGLTLFVTLTAIQTSLDAEISRSVPKRAPNQFVLDIPMGEQAKFEALVRAHAPEARLNLVPSLRGLIIAYGRQRVADLEEIPQGAWFLRGERGLTYSDRLPEGSELVAGQWWPENYTGPPLVSLDEEAAKIMAIGVGDTLTVSVLGREMEARVASLRRINWDTLGFNYIMVFSPNALRSAPHNLTSTITIDAAHAPAVARALLGAFPSISVIEVGELIGQVRTLLDQMAVAIGLAGSVTILAGIAVLIGAIAAARQARSYDSVILKTLGATRVQILTAQGLEYALLTAMLALVALVLGSAAAWYVIVELFEFGWAPDWPKVLATLAVGGIITLGIGLAGSLPIISVRPAAALRQLD